MNNGNSQTVLGFAPKSTAKGKGKAPDPLRQTQLPFAPKKKEVVQQHIALKSVSENNQQGRLRKQILAVLGVSEFHTSYML